MVVADTGAIIALVDARDRHHREMVAQFEEDGSSWVLPWAILPEVDYLLLNHVSARAAAMFLNDIAAGAFLVEWGDDADFQRAAELCAQYRALELGLVDGVVIAIAERLRASAIATLDVRDFGAVEIAGSPRLLPRDS